jgi:hypothetical protein
VHAFHVGRSVRQSPSVVAVAAAAAAAVLSLAACGSGASTYDQDAFGVCFRNYGATVSHLQGGVVPGSSNASTFSEHLPYAEVANFLDAADGTTVGEYVYFYAASDSALARDAEDWLNGRGEYAVLRFGNFVVASNAHPTAGLTKLIADCKKQAAKS